MLNIPPYLDADSPILLIDIGNTSIHVGTWADNRVRSATSCPSDDSAAFDEAFRAHSEAMPHGRPPAVVMASVAPHTLERLRTVLEARLDQEMLVIGESIPLPLDVSVRDKRAVGVDRICAAAAAYENLQGSCVVVDFGTAVTVDLVDDDGVFLGGAILPGVELQLRALHEYTAQLPMVKSGVPPQSFGRDTTEAMQVGVCRGIVGAVRGIVEGYATERYQWPFVVATGGDLPLLMPLCDFIDKAVADLTLAGVGLAYRKYLAARGV